MSDKIDFILQLLLPYAPVCSTNFELNPKAEEFEPSWALQEPSPPPEPSLKEGQEPEEYLITAALVEATQKEEEPEPSLKQELEQESEKYLITAAPVEATQKEEEPEPSPKQEPEQKSEKYLICETCELWAPRCLCDPPERILTELEPHLYLCNACCSTRDQDSIQRCSGERKHTQQPGCPIEGDFFHETCMKEAQHHPKCEFADDPIFLCAECLEMNQSAGCLGCKDARIAELRPKKRSEGHRKAKRKT